MRGQILRHYLFTFLFLTKSLGCSIQKNPSLVQSRFVDPGSSAVSPNTLIFEERDLTPFTENIKGDYSFVKATHADTDLAWHFSDLNNGGISHSVTQNQDLSGRPGVRPGPVFTPGSGTGSTNQISAEYDLFRGPPPPGDWTLYIKFLGNESLLSENIDNQNNQNISRVETASLGIRCLDDGFLSDIKRGGYWPVGAYFKPKDALHLLNRSIDQYIKFSARPFHQGSSFLAADSKIKAIDLLIKVEPHDVIGCSRVYAVVDMGSSWRAQKKFQFNQLELQMIYKGEYQNPAQFVKVGNDGTTYCANYCGSQIWDPEKGVGVCVGSQAEGQDFGCYESAATKFGRIIQQLCTCQKINFETHHSLNNKSCHINCLEFGKGICLSAHRDTQTLSCYEHIENKTCVCAAK